MVKQKIPFGDIQSMHKSKIFTGKMGFVALWVCSLYPGLPVIFLPAQNFKSWAVWQNENHSVAAEPQTSQQGATLKSCSHNIKADMAPLL